MTQHVRAGYRRHRKTTWVAGLVALVTGLAALAIVLPAGAVDTQLPPPSSPGNVTPTAHDSGGSTFTCSSVGASGFEIDVNNPRSGTTNYTFGGKSVSLTLVLSKTPVSVKDQYLSFKLTGAAASYVAVKGGNHTALYTYTGSAFGPATADGYGSGTAGVDVDTTTNPAKTDGTGLHAPLQSDGTPYSVSYTTFCVDLVATVSGTVYQDTNSNGALDSGEAGISGRTVTIKPDGGTAKSTQSGQSGSYSFVVSPGGSYTICAQQGANQAQTQPSSPVVCKNGVPVSTGGVDAGWQTGSLTGDLGNRDFGFTGGATGRCDGTPITAPTTDGGTYTASFSDATNSTKCEDTFQDKPLVFTTWQDAGHLFASLHPATAPAVQCQLATGANCVRVNETLHVTLPAGTPPRVLQYDDTAPYTSYEPMPFCKVDPASTSTLTDILPQRADSSYHTSCLVHSDQKVLNGSVDRTDNIFSAQDGNRTY